ncbi:DUF637 domain-containing protein [Hydrogenophaga sp. 5NK40-0174]|uniref:DUF637 domain-containing protein n=1 Tax=Hydrogenophaga sp. 5NK40-0174 TaxID=3127649 RepID=UPI0033428560
MTTVTGSSVVLSAGGAAFATAVSAGVSSLAATAAVSLINNKGDIGAVLDELGSSENVRSVLLSMATAGATYGLLNNIPVEPGSSTMLASVDANSSVGQLLARNAVQGITSAVLESAIMGTDLEEALQNNLRTAVVNTFAAQGAHAIGEANLDEVSRAMAHALLGCAVGSAMADSSGGCAAGAAGGVMGELMAGWYASASDYDQLKIDANKDGASPELVAQFKETTEQMNQLSRLMGAAGALLVGGDADSMNLAAATALNAAQNNRQLHVNERALIRQLATQRAEALCEGNPTCDVNQVAAQYADAMQRVAELRADAEKGEQHEAYLTELARAAEQDGTVASLGGFDNYLALLNDAASLLDPYTGRTILVNGQPAVDDNGEVQTYFSATERQRQNPHINAPLFGGTRGDIAPGMGLRDEDRLEFMNAINGSATPIYPVEELVLGGAVGNRLAAALDRVLMGSVARGASDERNLANVWDMNWFERGNAIESHLARTEYKDWFNIGQLNNGKFELVDFQYGNNLVSLKSVDTNGATWLRRMQDHIYDLGSNGATVDGKPANMILDIRVQPGGAAAAHSLIQYGAGNNVTVIIKEFK